ncbi:hypothetical protein Zmor_021275 [Zophobas morio]|uniref:Uncharacterized protein n=1 Tax=Zophobas morio TaxID=2755281 RepID=A0AA38MAE1_9CUCU|nr:hypothetical protein Zmor_021275 [Zophobas morio]
MFLAHPNKLVSRLCSFCHNVTHPSPIQNPIIQNPLPPATRITLCLHRASVILEPSLSGAWRRSAAASRADAADPREASPAAPFPGPRSLASVTHTGREHSSQSVARSVRAAHLAGDGDGGGRRRGPRPRGAAVGRVGALPNFTIYGARYTACNYRRSNSPRPHVPSKLAAAAAGPVPCEIADLPDVTAAPTNGRRRPNGPASYTAYGIHLKSIPALLMLMWDAWL